ncbi:MAG: capsular biosynthesis protein [Magnetococcales bacterium]|nr:capsular biosynthesis protein [Magnetococcales bacterium]
MRICLDLDGVLCALKKEGENYADLLPLPGAVEKVTALKKSGHTIILHTARHMKTCEGNSGKVIARLGRITLEWLDRHGIPYDELHFGKPWADIYVDDNAWRFESWESIEADGSNLPCSSEQKARQV